MSGADQPPRVIGRYALHGILATGGMATVHVGRLLGPVGFSRTVAIKRMHDQFARDPEFVAMFLDEAQLASRIRHPNAVAVIDVVASNGEVLLVMEYVQGETLSRLMRRVNDLQEKVPPPVAAAIVIDLLEGLHAAHEARDGRGVPLEMVHRDVSPQNVIVGIDGVARVLDFGIAKAAGRSQVTREGQLKGKLSYMAPEQLKGEATRASDICAAGIVFWEALTGRRLYQGANEAQTVTMVLTEKVRPPSECGGPNEYDAVLLKALSREPGDRFATAREMSIAISEAAPHAAPHDVAAWLERVAKDVLEARAEIISTVESGGSVTSPEAPTQVEPAVDTTMGTQADLLPKKSAPRRRSLLLLTAGALAVVGVMAAVRSLIRTFSPAVAPPPSVSVSVSVSVPVPAAGSLGSGSEPPPRSTASAPPPSSAVAPSSSASKPAAPPRPVPRVTPQSPRPVPPASPRPNSGTPDHI
jgi:serine/threonine-protein kinase